jgi:hypothetical protein
MIASKGLFIRVQDTTDAATLRRRTREITAEARRTSCL